MSYALIDPILKDWIKAEGLVLQHDARWGERRFFHQSSDAGECFQIVVEAQPNDMVHIDAHLIESPGEDVTHFTWTVPLSEFSRALDLSAQSFRGWFKGRAIVQMPGSRR